MQKISTSHHVLAFVTTHIAGCDGGGGGTASIDPLRAYGALRTALDSWKKGEKPDALKLALPSIVVQDFDWMAGQQLITYEVTGDAKDDDANLRIPVKLTLKNAIGQEIKKTVSYVVGASPVLTVFRDFR